MLVFSTGWTVQNTLLKKNRLIQVRVLPLDMRLEIVSTRPKLGFFPARPIASSANVPIWVADSGVKAMHALSMSL
jgi:hypothetical protein